MWRVAQISITREMLGIVLGTQVCRHVFGALLQAYCICSLVMLREIKFKNVLGQRMSHRNKHNTVAWLWNQLLLARPKCINPIKSNVTMVRVCACVRAHARERARERADWQHLSQRGLGPGLQIFFPVRDPYSLASYSRGLPNRSRLHVLPSVASAYEAGVRGPLAEFRHQCVVGFYATQSRRETHFLSILEDDVREQLGIRIVIREEPLPTYN